MVLQIHILLHTTRTGYIVQYVESTCIIIAAESGRVRTSTVDFVCGISEFSAERTIARTDKVTSTAATPRMHVYMFLYGACLYRLETNKN
jgi:hypothetical protein